MSEQTCGAAPFTKSVRQHIEAEARNGTPDQIVANGLGWNLEKLHRIKRAHGIIFVIDQAECISQMIVRAHESVIVEQQRIHPYGGPKLRPQRSATRANTLTVRLALTSGDRARLGKMAELADCRLSTLVGSLVEAVNETNSWERLLGLKG
jgi:hypothetical protein